ncbi:hypothetical protein A1O1_04470 [Capronia coronata CBS 617.96]|uniref:Uncharacterized protein n=1 Tax=Capronia coronata CBS 617.96 TaxID=1182541 RepID=W9YFS2_9EURO|nr:uncharacterized protein A1O1_04470 [Capronia coronata CBS 617.96]EXJ91358.1 hypothetical protein A1O1_04470 [Capronia coronata CBS 617.96]
MSNPTWTITSTKRKTKSATPFSRKRPRLNDIKGKLGSSRRPGDSQQTLTQAQWLTPPATSFEEEEIVCSEPTEKPRSTAKSTTTDRRRPLKKRDSTLTQMDFLSFPPPDDADFDDTMLPPAEPKIRALPQLDGTYDSPRKPRKRKATPSMAAPPAKRKDVPMNTESQDYQPSRRKRKVEVEDEEPSSSSRRASRRLATKKEVFSDPVQNLAYFEEAFGTTTPQNEQHKEKRGASLGYPLEIKDSLDDDDDLIYSGPTSHEPTLLPKTPKKNRAIVLSSQSPESLPPSTRRTDRRTTELPTVSQRTPLAERSVNIPLGPVSKLSPRKPRRVRKRSAKKKQKIVTLKLPKRTEPRRSPRVEDSQIDLWSIPLSSSPRQAGHRTGTGKFPQQAQNPVQVARQMNEAEIPATSQPQNVQSSPPDTEPQDTLPDIVELLGPIVPEECAGMQAEKTGEQQGTLTRDAAAEPIVRDFAFSPIKERIGHTRVPHEANDLPSESRNSSRDEVICAEEADVKDIDDADFGSPIANDTQFSVAVEYRISSPAPMEPLKPADTLSVAALELSIHSPSSTGPDRAMPMPTLAEDAEPLQTPLPLPRLVEQSTAKSPAKVVPDSEDESDEISLPNHGTSHQSSTHVSTTKLPLNDIGHSSSSASLLSTEPATPRSVHPASLHRPSQMSTQEPTQGYLNMASYPTLHVEGGSDEDKAEKITIKDSSSCHVSMTQLPQYNGQSQSQVNIDLGLDEVFHPAEDEDGDEEEGDLDLDLDPPTLRLSKKPDFVMINDDEELVTPRQQRAGSRADQNKAADVQVEDDDIDDHHEHPGGFSQKRAVADDQSPIRSSQSISIPSSPNPPQLTREYSPIPGFNNETQSNFTQNGHVTAAYIHRQHEAGVLPKWFIPQPYQVPGYTRRR